MQVRTLGRKGLALVAVALASVVASPAFAAADAAFTAAATETTTNVGLMGAALVAVAAAGVGFMVAMKYVKKLGRAA